FADRPKPEKLHGSGSSLILLVPDDVTTCAGHSRRASHMLSFTASRPRADVRQGPDSKRQDEHHGRCTNCNSEGIIKFALLQIIEDHWTRPRVVLQVLDFDFVYRPNSMSLRG